MDVEMKHRLSRTRTYVEHGAIPFGHFLEAGGAQNRVRKFRRRDFFRFTADTLWLCRHRRSSCASLIAVRVTARYFRR